MLRSCFIILKNLSSAAEPKKTLKKTFLPTNPNQGLRKVNIALRIIKDKSTRLYRKKNKVSKISSSQFQVGKKRSTKGFLICQFHLWDVNLSLVSVNLSVTFSEPEKCLLSSSKIYVINNHVKFK